MKILSEKQVKQIRLRNLIELVLDRFDEEEVVEAFNYMTDKEYVEKSEVGEHDMVTELAAKGYCIFKPLYGYQAEELKFYAQKEVFPYINEQEVAILF